MAPRKKSPAQLDRDIQKVLAGVTKNDLLKLVDAWKSAAAFNHQQAENDPDDAGYRGGYAAASERAARDLLDLIQKK